MQTGHVDIQQSIEREHRIEAFVDEMGMPQTRDEFIAFIREFVSKDTFALQSDLDRLRSAARGTGGEGGYGARARYLWMCRLCPRTRRPKGPALMPIWNTIAPRSIGDNKNGGYDDAH